MKNGDFSALLANRGSNLNSIPQLRIPQGFPGAGEPAPNNDMRPYVTPLGKYLASLYPSPNYNDPNNLYNYVYSRLEPLNRTDFKTRVRLEHQQQSTKAYVRIARESEAAENPRGVWWGPSDVALPSPNIGTNNGRSFSGNVVSVLSPSMTNEALVSYSRLDARQPFQGPTRHPRRAPAASPSTGFSLPARPARICRPTSSTVGARATARSATSGPPPTTCTPTTTRCSSATS